MFIYVFWEKERELGRSRERERERERETQAGSELLVQGLDPMNYEIMTLAEIKSQMLNRLSCPGAPRVPVLFFFFF